MKVKDLLVYLENLLAVRSFTDYCPNGLQVGEENATVEKVAFGVTADLETVKQAKDFHADVLIVHHGILWSGEPLPIIRRKKARIEALLEAKISLCAYHFPLDAHRELGNNWKVAKDLRWSNLKVFGSSTLPLGVGGEFSPMKRESFEELLTRYYGSKPLGLASGGKNTVSSAALMSGGAYREIDVAAASGYDCFITGNYDEPAWSIAMEEKVNFFAYGHTVTEKVGIKALAEKLEEEFGFVCKICSSSNLF